MRGYVERDEKRLKPKETAFRVTDLLTKQEIETLKEIAEIMRKEDTLWGL